MSPIVGSRATLVLAGLMAFALGACTSAPSQQSAAEAIDDGVVTAKVKAALIEDPVTGVHQIEVDTFRGIVQLKGFVETEEARSRALQVTKQIDGVRNIRNALEIRKAAS